MTARIEKVGSCEWWAVVGEGSGIVHSPQCGPGKQSRTSHRLVWRPSVCRCPLTTRLPSPPMAAAERRVPPDAQHHRSRPGPWALRFNHFAVHFEIECAVAASLGFLHALELSKPVFQLSACSLQQCLFWLHLAVPQKRAYSILCQVEGHIVGSILRAADMDRS